jgi:predicted GNAT superfamily acetyltransferase
MPYAAGMATAASEPKQAETAVQIREVRGPAELRACQALQRRAWGITEDGYLVPVATMVAVQKVGGSVLGAFEPDGQLVGFAFAFLGRFNGRDVLYSQLAAVLPEAQSRGIGRALKLEQRRRAQASGLDAVVWAFDPLQAGNAFFNLGVLGATCRTYEVDMYGSRADALNVGLATDRLLAEWPTRGDPVPCSEAWPEAPHLVETAPSAEGSRVAVASREAVQASSDRVRIEIPRQIGKESPDEARQWQQLVRRAFQSAFAAGFAAVGFSRGEQPCYLLRREAPA